MTPIIVTNKKILKMPLDDFVKWISDSFFVEVQEDISNLTIDDANNIAKMMSQATNAYTYLIQVRAYLQSAYRTSKNNKEKPEIYQDYMDKRDFIDTAISASKQQYNNLSRLITVRQSIVEELRMADFTPKP